MIQSLKCFFWLCEFSSMNQIEKMMSSPKIFPKCIDEENISSNNFNNHNNHYFYFFAVSISAIQGD